MYVYTNSIGLGTLTVLEKYGELSSLSNTHSWSRGKFPDDMPVPPLGHEDMEEEGEEMSMKGDWIMELSGCYNGIVPIAEVARDQAAM